MKRIGYLLLLILFGSCEAFYPVPETKTEFSETKENKAKECVQSHVKTTFTNQAVYTPFQFGELFVLKPNEIVELESMIAFKNNMPLNSEQYGNSYEDSLAAQDLKISNKKTSIKEQKVFPWYEITHIFAIKTNGQDSIRLFECNFEVFPNYTIKDVHQLMSVKLSQAEFKTFQYFFNQNPLYESVNSEWSNEKNEAFYRQAFAALEAEKEYKDELIRTIIRMVEYILEKNDFNQDQFALKVVKEWEAINLPKDIVSVKYDDLTPLLLNSNGTDKIVGYTLAHKFTNSDKEQIFVYTFDLNFVLLSITEKK